VVSLHGGWTACESTCAEHLEEDAKTRASLVRAFLDPLEVHAGSYEVSIKFHMDMRTSGYLTGYELLHRSAPEDGDFNILEASLLRVHAMAT